jgi:hypothetical protein
MSQKMTRMESNKAARTVLNRHQVDLAYCQYSCCGMEVKLTGWLCKHDGTDFNGPQISAIIFDFQRYLTGFTISGDFDNWNFTSDRISFVGERDRKENGEEMEQMVYEIDLDDYDFEAG